MAEWTSEYTCIVTTLLWRCCNQRTCVRFTSWRCSSGRNCNNPSYNIHIVRCWKLQPTSLPDPHFNGRHRMRRTFSNFWLWFSICERQLHITSSCNAALHGSWNWSRRHVRDCQYYWSNSNSSLSEWSLSYWTNPCRSFNYDHFTHWRSCILPWLLHFSACSSQFLYLCWSLCYHTLLLISYNLCALVLTRLAKTTLQESWLLWALLLQRR